LEADTEACKDQETDVEKFRDCMRGKNWLFPGDKGYRPPVKQAPAQ